MATRDAFPEVLANPRPPGGHYLKGVTDNGREGILPLTYNQLATTCSSNINYCYLISAEWIFRIFTWYFLGAVKIRHGHSFKHGDVWLIIVPEQVGEIDPSEVN